MSRLGVPMALALAVSPAMGCRRPSSECRSLTVAIEKTQDRLDAVVGLGDADGARRFADAIDRAVDDLDGVRLDDPELAGYRTRYRALLVEYAADLRTIVESLERGDDAKAREAIAHGTRMERASAELVGDLEDRCASGK